MKLASVVGARPQFIKYFVVAAALKRSSLTDHVLIHTGQHYDPEMSAIFFDELDLDPPSHDLAIGSGSHGAQTAAMLIGIERALTAERPDVVLVYGDTNSTLAAALAAAKLGMPVAHIEAGLRSHRRDMPEEINRVMADHLSALLFAPTHHAVSNLCREGLTSGVHNVGDVMFDAVRTMADAVASRSTILGDLRLEPRGYTLATVHRAANTDDDTRLARIVEALGAIPDRVMFPVHPRTRHAIDAAGLRMPENVEALAPVGYLEMLVLERNARRILTDSGGVQKEAYFFAVPCVTLRAETEWVETVSSGWNVLADADVEAVRDAWHRPRPAGTPPAAFGHGDAGDRIAAVLAAGERT